MRGSKRTEAEMRRLTPLDATFLHLESGEVQANVAWMSTFEGPASDHAELLNYVEGKLPFVPRYRQKLRFLPLAMARPVWIDDPHFNLEYHVRRTALPAPGGDRELDRLFARVVSQQLDRRRPLWEMWVVEGLSEGRWGVLWKLHHAMVDGVTASEINTVMLSDKRDAERPEPAPWQPEPGPGALAVAVESLAGLMSPLEQLQSLRLAVKAPRDLLERGVAAARSALPLGRNLLKGGTSSLNGPIGPHRRFDRTTVSLQDVKEVRKRHGGTVNDVVLAAVASGFRELLAARGELAPETVVSTMVPVSVRAPGEHGGNRVSAVFARLPVGEEDPVCRLQGISSQMDDIKRRGDAVAGQALVSLQGFSPPMLLALGSRLAASLPQRTINTVTTNVPGPQHPLYLLGRRMLEAAPYVMLGPQIRIATAIFSYDGRLHFGVTGDYDTAPDIDLVCAGIERGIAELGGGDRPTQTRPASNGTGVRREQRSGRAGSGA
ncbi:MAG: WS/DGAT/MGAT family O-acyltransferase [Mycobacterium sp.]|uniref:WS/DGAT/MGAT family O-acyltransferase n=1 Tax=Mycobacterium sp. TaxID=1785 RepID=UPI003F97527C